MPAADALQPDIEPLSTAAGAEIVGLDLRQPPTPDLRRAVHSAFLRYRLPVFRDQDLDKRHQVALSRRFGELEGHTLRNRGVGDEPFVHVVSNLDDDGRPTGRVNSTLWRTDKSFRALPSMATILYASHIEGRPMDKGRRRIEELEAHATASPFVYRHGWRAGDLLMWDNRCLLHRADPNFDAASHARILHRACLRGTAPA